MEITRLTKINHYEQITEQIKQQIIRGELKAGERLPSTKELAERFGVGRSSMREALSALKAMGLIDIRQGGNSTVIGPSQQETAPIPGLAHLQTNKQTVLELLEARKALEVSNAGIAATKATETDIRQLAAIVSQMEMHIGNEEIGEQTDWQFHSTLVQATHNSIMVSLFTSISTQMESAIRDTRRIELYANKSVSQRLYEEHRAIYEAVRTRDAESAQRTMNEHLIHVETILMKYLK
ncbi:FadR/GntR family transcriptional regulator [Brevibacillus fluminis]|uniref:FadR/GntR family transcriptional regulator n=1 Tax=Brevibacillus fluminis TaxID=511487 RepID=UPI003F8AF04F